MPLVARSFCKRDTHFLLYWSAVAEMNNGPIYLAVEMKKKNKFAFPRFGEVVDALESFFLLWQCIKTIMNLFTSGAKFWIVPFYDYYHVDIEKLISTPRRLL